MTPSGVEVRGLSKSLGSRQVLCELDFALEMGKTGAIVGPSGAGKTTLLNIISGLVVADAGRVAIDGVTVAQSSEGKPRIHVPPSVRNVGYVFQDYLLFPHMTVFENVAYGLRARHSPSSTVMEKVSGALERMGVRELRDKKPSQISGGEMQRVALARAIVLEPKLLLMDEPLSALDRSTRETLRLELKRTFDELATTVLYVTHDLDEAFFLGQSLGILHSGRLSFFSSKGDLLGRMGRSTAEFLGFNLVEGRLLAVNGSGGTLQIPGWEPVTVPLLNESAGRVGQDVVVAVPPESVRIVTQGGAPGVRARINDVWEFKDRVQIVLGDPGKRLVCEVSSLEFRKLALNRGDYVKLTLENALLLSQTA